MWEAELSVSLPSLKRNTAPKPEPKIEIKVDEKQPVTLPSLFKSG